MLISSVMAGVVSPGTCLSLLVVCVVPYVAQFAGLPYSISPGVLDGFWFFDSVIMMVAMASFSAMAISSRSGSVYWSKCLMRAVTILRPVS